MAARLRVWIGLLALGCVTLAVLTLPPSGFGDRFASVEDTRTPERRRAMEIGAELRAVQEALVRLGWSDSLSALAWGAADLPVPVVVGVPEVADRRPFAGEGLWELTDNRLQDRNFLTASALAREAKGAQFDPRAAALVSDRVVGELAQLGAERPAVDLGVFLIPNEAIDGVRSIDRVEWYAGSREGRPYCLTVRTSAYPHETDLVSYTWRAEGDWKRTEILGPCGFYARYGMPSTTIQRWMQGPGGALAIERSERERVLGTDAEPASLFGRRNEVGTRTLELEGCTVGHASACAATLFSESSESWDRVEPFEAQIIAAGVPLLDGRPIQRGTYSLVEVSSARMLDAVERRFGAEAFARFWHSDQPVAEAFTSAFGVSPESWGNDWAISVYGDAARAGVLPGRGDWVIGLLYLSFALLGASGIMRARRLG
jgi:hypothetical protein